MMQTTHVVAKTNSNMRHVQQDALPMRSQPIILSNTYTMWQR